MTVFVSLFCWWMVNNFPDTARFLTSDEKLRALRRLRADGQARAETEKFNRKYVWAAVKDWKTWGYAVIYMGCLCPLYCEFDMLFLLSGMRILLKTGKRSVSSFPLSSRGWATRNRRLCSFYPFRHTLAPQS